MSSVIEIQFVFRSYIIRTSCTNDDSADQTNDEQILNQAGIEMSIERSGEVSDGGEYHSQLRTQKFTRRYYGKRRQGSAASDQRLGENCWKIIIRIQKCRDSL